MKKGIKIVLLVVVISLITCGITYSKYVSNYVWDYYLKSKGFYFNSDTLSSNRRTNSNNSWDGSSVHFSVRNNLNKSLISEVDINYTVTCEINTPNTSAICKVNGSNSNIYNGVLSKSQVCLNKSEDGINTTSFNKTECDEGGYVYTNQIVDSNLYFDIEGIEELTDISVKITVSANSPYTKTISGDFLLHKDTVKNDIEVNYINYSDFDKLIIANITNDTKCILVNFDSSKLLIDSELNNFVTYNSNESGYINEIKIKLEPNKMKDYTFYKTDGNVNYDINAFNITNTTGC